MGHTEEAEGKYVVAASGLKPLIHSRAVIAALEALRHPKSESFLLVHVCQGELA
jgi:hypothetical protein